MMDNPIVFLDIDGVLNSVNWYKKRDGMKKPFQEFDPYCVDMLNQITRRFDCKIVVSSSWRILIDENDLVSILNKVGVEAEIVGYTKRFFHDDCRVPRGTEIQQWLKDNGYQNEELSYCKDDMNFIEKLFYTVPYIILDDSTDMLWEQKDNFIKTDVMTGLCVGDALKAHGSLVMQGAKIIK